MESVFLQLPIESSPAEGNFSDINAPFSFLEWKQRRPGLIEKQAPYQYGRYILRWFNKNKEKKVSHSFLIRQKYLYLLDQLQLFFTDEEKHKWYNNINLMNEKELLLSIPYFAKKLKDVALYYLRLRSEVKNAKLKYNTVGTSFGVEQDLYAAMLKTFSNLNKEITPTLHSAIPQLSSIKESLVIQIEELYDDKDYFDVSPTTPITERFDILNSVTEQFYQTKGISLSSEEWMFTCLSLSPELDLNTFVEQITAAVLETTDLDLYEEFITKYLAENKYSVIFDALSSEYDLTEIRLSEGNNYFYYPGGTTDPTVMFERKLKNISLSSINMDGASAGTTLEEADTIFVKNGTDVKGAWLKYQEFEDQTELLEATLKQYGTTTFIFPYPGYGLSSEDTTWTGPSFISTPEYPFLANYLRSAIDVAYWSQDIGSNSMEPIMINSSTLLEQGALPNKNPNFSDKVFERIDYKVGNGIPALELKGAWLYHFTHALFPVSPQQENRFLWPFEIIDKEKEYPSYFVDYDFSTVCEPVKISDIISPYSIASDSFETSDKIYKFANYSDEIENATECCWLSSNPIAYSSVQRGFEQNGFVGLFNSGTVEKFVWNGPNNTPLAQVFSGIKHKNDCPFVTNIPSVSTLEWEKCSCKQVYYSPFGHNGNLFEDNNGFADFIAVDYSRGTREFDIDSWRDVFGIPFKGSDNVAWYKTNSDWGHGEWVNNSNPITNTPMLLQHGQTYYYGRAKGKTGNSLPPLVVNYTLPGSPNSGVWVGARKNEDDEWVSTGLESNMILYPGDVVHYERANKTTYYYVSSELVEDVSENRESIWSTFDYIVSGTPQSTVYISWPTGDPPIGNLSYPPFSVLELSALHWWKIQHTTNPAVSATITSGKFPKTIIPFEPPILGTYSITASAMDINGNHVHITNIPLLSVMPQYKSQELLIEQETAATGFLIEQPLYGWDYLAGKQTLNSTGAKPFWAELYINKGTENRLKGAYSWGYSNNFVDEYVPDHCPKLSDFSFAYGRTVSYERSGPALTWYQPITFKVTDGSSMWCALSVSTTETSNLCSLYISKFGTPDLNVYPLSDPTDIELTNINNGLPVEVFYYALNSFTWTISTEVLQEANTSPIPTLYLKAASPWANLGNRFFSTIATAPLLDEIYSETDTGGYFIPQNLGASLATNKDFTPVLKNNSLSGSYLVEDTTVHLGGRGRTRSDQETLYDWTEQNQWMKEPFSAGRLAGSVKKNLTKTLQTFVPYQEGSEETALGLLTPKSRVSPWGGKYGSTWTDLKNEPKSFTEVRNVSAWADSQVLKQNELVVDQWVSDIYGNQFALFKDVQTTSRVSDQRKIFGNLWIKTNQQSVMPATQALSLVYDMLKSKTYYSELTGTGILSIECFFDTLMLETSGALVFCPMDYDYNNATISSVYDDCTFIENLSLNMRFENTWLFPKTKNAIVLFTELSAGSFIPYIYNLNLNDKTYTNVFPRRPENFSNIQLGLSGITVATLDRAALNFNSLQQTYFITYKGTDTLGKMFVVDFRIEQREDLILETVDRYLDSSVITAVIDPPEITNSSYFTTYSVTTGSSFSISISAENFPSGWSLVGSYPFPISVNSTGTFTGTISIPGTYYVNYEVNNSGGSTVYPLTIQAL